MNVHTTELDRLFAENEGLRGPKRLSALLATVGRFKNLSILNAALLDLQKPGCRFAAPLKEWRSHFGRTAKHDATPIVLLQPFAPVTFLYDMRDTEGDPVPKGALPSGARKHTPDKHMISELVARCVQEGIEIRLSDIGTRAYAEYTDTKILSEQYDGGIIRMQSHHTIYADSSLSSAEQFGAILRELARIYLGHLYHDDTLFPWLPHRYDMALGEDIQQFEVEATAALVCDRLSLRDPYSSFLDTFARGTEPAPVFSLDSVLKASAKIETIISGNLTPRPDLLIEREEPVCQLSLFDLVEDA